MSHQRAVTPFGCVIYPDIPRMAQRQGVRGGARGTEPALLPSSRGAGCTRAMPSNPTCPIRLLPYGLCPVSRGCGVLTFQGISKDAGGGRVSVGRIHHRERRPQTYGHPNAGYRNPTEGVKTEGTIEAPANYKAEMFPAERFTGADSEATKVQHLGSVEGRGRTAPSGTYWRPANRVQGPFHDPEERRDGTQHVRQHDLICIPCACDPLTHVSTEAQSSVRKITDVS